MTMISTVRRFAIGACAVCFAFLIAARLRAEVILPTGLAPNSEYEIVFVTADAVSAASSNIDSYNSFVAKEANEDVVLRNLGVAWHAIVSTDATNANVNAPFTAGIPVYNTAGQLVADAASPLYSGTLYAGIGFSQFGLNSGTRLVWTGSLAGGIAADTTPGFDCTMGGASGGTGLGRSAATDANWLSIGLAGNRSQMPPNSLYALSAPITVAPEPSAFVLLCAGSLGLLGYAWCRPKLAGRVRIP